MTIEIIERDMIIMARKSRPPELSRGGPTWWVGGPWTPQKFFIPLQIYYFIYYSLRRVPAKIIIQTETPQQNFSLQFFSQRLKDGFPPKNN
jgi:hypothetical protein